MCGFVGFTSSEDIEKNINILKEMNVKLTHRGPDGEGYYNDGNIFLGHKRLSIIDLNKRSNQPFSDNEEKHIIVYNGEIYNYIELKKELEKEKYIFSTTSDTEVLLKAYIHWGPNFLKKIKGMFSFVILKLPWLVFHVKPMLSISCPLSLFLGQGKVEVCSVAFIFILLKFRFLYFFKSTL